MRRKKSTRRGWAVSILAACSIGYLIAGWHTTALRSTDDLPAAETVALRFPEEWRNASPVTAVSAGAAATVTAARSANTANAADDAQLALLSPVPMNPQTMFPQAVALEASQPARWQQQALQQDPPQADEQAMPQTASAEDGGTAGATEMSAGQPLQLVSPDAAPPARSAAPRPVAETKAAPVAARHHVANRPGYMLDDAQIASIKERLHLTPDQEQMWPAVEAALRNMAYTREQEARGRSLAADGTQTAALDPNSVQGLKSAAVPLILSFSAEQKEQVRNIAHVMGLDQLASQF